MADKSEVLDALDHPIFFSFAITLAVVGWLALLTWGSKAAGWSGPAALFQHP